MNFCREKTEFATEHADRKMFGICNHNRVLKELQSGERFATITLLLKLQKNIIGVLNNYNLSNVDNFFSFGAKIPREEKLSF